MKRNAILSVLFTCLLLLLSGSAFSGDTEYYARCNLKVIKGSYITWVNWQSTPTVVPVGTKFIVSHNGSKAQLEDAKTGKVYNLDIGASGDEYLEKFVTTKRIKIKGFSAIVQKNIKKALAKVGMTKKEVYIAMGPPANVDRVNSNDKTYEKIMQGNLWVYKRKRFGKNIGVSFDQDGLVDRTEGIWRD